MKSLQSRNFFPRQKEPHLKKVHSFFLPTELLCFYNVFQFSSEISKENFLDDVSFTPLQLWLVGVLSTVHKKGRKGILQKVVQNRYVTWLKPLQEKYF